MLNALSLPLPPAADQRFDMDAATGMERGHPGTAGALAALPHTCHSQAAYGLQRAPHDCAAAGHLTTRYTAKPRLCCASHASPAGAHPAMGGLGGASPVSIGELGGSGMGGGGAGEGSGQDQVGDTSLLLLLLLPGQPKREDAHVHLCQRCKWEVCCKQLLDTCPMSAESKNQRCAALCCPAAGEAPGAGHAAARLRAVFGWGSVQMASDKRRRYNRSS